MERLSKYLTNGNLIGKIRDLTADNKLPDLITNSSIGDMNGDGLNYSSLSMFYPDEPYKADFMAVSGIYDGVVSDYRGRRVDAVASLGYDPSSLKKEVDEFEHFNSKLLIEANRKREKQLQRVETERESLKLLDLLTIFEAKLSMAEMSRMRGNVPLDEKVEHKEKIRRYEGVINGIGALISASASAFPHTEYDLKPSTV